MLFLDFKIKSEGKSGKSHFSAFLWGYMLQNTPELRKKRQFSSNIAKVRP